jgi:hypothetical protein
MGLKKTSKHFFNNNILKMTLSLPEKSQHLISFFIYILLKYDFHFIILSLQTKDIRKS